jgi:hypothetical protein
MKLLALPWVCNFKLYWKKLAYHVIAFVKDKGNNFGIMVVEL